MEKNQFDLKNRKGAGPQRTHVGRDWTEEEIADRLRNYLEVPREYWEAVRAGTHVRYYHKTEGYRPGGFVQKNPFITKPDGSQTEKTFMKIQTGFDQKASNYSSWIAAYEDMARLFVKLDAAALVAIKLQEAPIVKLNDNIKKLALQIQMLNERVDILERHTK